MLRKFKRQSGDTMVEITIGEDHDFAHHANGATMTVKGAGHVDGMDRWMCEVTANGRSIVVNFGLGTGHGGRKPEISEVLAAYAFDAFAFENARNVDDFAADLGITKISEALRCYHACEKAFEDLEAFAPEDWRSFGEGD